MKRKQGQFTNIGTQISLIFGLCLFLAIASLLSFNYYERRNALTHHLVDEGIETGSLLARKGEKYLILGDLASLEQTLLHSATDVDTVGIQITNPDGILISGVERYDNGTISPMYGHKIYSTPASFERQTIMQSDGLLVWSPIVSDRNLGWVRIEYSLGRLAEANKAILLESLTSGLTALLLCLATLHFFLKPRILTIVETARLAQSMGKSPDPLLADNYLSRETNLLTSAINRASIELFEQSERLIKEQKKTESLLNSIPVAVFGVDLQGVCIFQNPLCGVLCGYAEEKSFIGSNIIDLLFTDQRAELALNDRTESALRLRLNTQVVNHQSEFFRSDRTRVPCEYWSHPIRHEGKIVGHIVSFVDISERIAAEDKRAMLEKQLQQSQKMQAIGQLTGGIAHDFNNILAAVMGHSGLARERARTFHDPKLDSYLQEIFNGSQRASALVKQMLAFGRANAGSPKAIEIETSVREFSNLVKPILPSSIDFQLSTTDPEIIIKADPVHLQQILMNLCLNASDAVSGKGQLSIVTSSRVVNQEHCSSCQEIFNGEFASIKIIDNGSGIQPHLLSRLFDPFFTTKEVGKGSGMGLSMVHGLVHENRGHINVASSPGRGTVFELLLPLHLERERVERLETSPYSDLIVEEKFMDKRMPHILVIDDEESVAKFLYELFELKGYSTCMETNSVTAYERFLKTPDYFDLVVTDQTMPGMSGYELADRFLKLRPDLPIILCTGYSEQISKEKALELGIKSYQEKPINVQSLCTTISSLLA